MDFEFASFSKLKLKYLGVLFFIILLILFLILDNKPFRDAANSSSTKNKLSKKTKLYWFIPDGFRADPITMKVFEWAQAGELPNIKYMMEKGSYGYSIPVFPGHTPVNTATLMTGARPAIHGVTEGAIRETGFPLETVMKNGFSSTSKLVPPIWYTLEENNYSVTLLSMPGSTPPELTNGITIRGRWGGWGIDVPAIIFQSIDGFTSTNDDKINHLAFNFGPDLANFSRVLPISSWQISLPSSYSQPQEVTLSNWGSTIYGYIYDSLNDNITNYDRILFSKDKKSIFCDLKVGDWSEWLPITLRWQTKNDYNIHNPKLMGWERELSETTINTQVKIRIIRLQDEKFFRIRFFYSNLNEHLIQPSYLYEDVISQVGPMVDFVDNYPPQLVYFPEDKNVFLEEMKMSFAWHSKMLKYLIESTNSEIIIHNIYSPNQMLTSRWWLPYLDPKSPKYKEVDEKQRQQLWMELKDMYKSVDQILGEAINKMEPDSYIVLSSDHGAIPLYKEVKLNNLFAKKGWLKFRYNKKKQLHIIDWENTKVVYLKMDNIYINPKGLKGPYYRASGSEYKKLREEVVATLAELKDVNGQSILDRATTWEHANELGLPNDRVGDLVIANHAGYNWVEDMSEDLEIFSTTQKGGYKQAVMAETEQGMWTPFVIMGPNVKANFEIKEPIRHIDQYPTIMTLLGQKIPSFVEGKVLNEIVNK